MKQDLTLITIAVSLLYILVISTANITFNVIIKEKIEKLETNYINRFEPLVKDSIKMHQWYENWESTYQEKNNILNNTNYE